MRRVAVIGAGAAGSMAAIFAASAGAETTLLERTADGGRKILISGGGRCNILPARLDESRFITDSSPRTLRNMLRSWPLPEQIEFFQRELHLPLVEETESGKLFPESNRAREVRDGLLALARERGARLRFNSLVRGIGPGETGWKIEIQDSPALEVDAVIMSTGGLSVPKTGSDGLGTSMVERLGHTIHPMYPALTPLTADPAPFAQLAGVSLEVTISARAAERRATATGGFLFTHHGYSGPAVLDVSHVAVRSRDLPARITVCWTPLDEAAWHSALQADGARTVRSTLREHLPDRLAQALAASAAVNPTRPLAQLRREERHRLVQTLVRAELPWTGHEGYKKAEVTGGGVSLAEVDPRTMESRRQRGLFLCGEMLDAFGPIGGYNFYWAWATGRAAGVGAARK
ncbi:MAG: aminoacetone oxidase family FAD-binding enzyme [Gemmatimonadetes bacterium]|nr:aminoacetone oxidase family FAD-binding enzyme [Gemmatimonadota bacterium]